eukprot:CAMPEP_0181190428 /NCGR_PEP_ID=MMETSP1096-20121128/12188_1 /TAXON_ID=156174 ORGANISM="Chrysochromulina ericina, Strain CCMP281" /NCGR_SAMPLE_ID=MMETSP1096 /ASSEMBLY_ACC=CAM_ASM_000453 /LENGTH=128 /DNA_ID=CAMNT_0023279643 /DNA_START=330 /DNA_END=715 /DNA_ORIENTATION=+
MYLIVFARSVGSGFPGMYGDGGDSCTSFHRPRASNAMAAALDPSAAESVPASSIPEPMSENDIAVRSRYTDPLGEEVVEMSDIREDTNTRNTIKRVSRKGQGLTVEISDDQLRVHPRLYACKQINRSG